MSRDLTRYDRFGWDYPSLNALTDAEVNWHLRWAKRAGGPVLMLACGTGRLACRLARAGFDVTGVDLSETMLGLARAEAKLLPLAAPKRVRLVKADMARFRLRQRFGLAIIADNSFRELPTRRELGRCLRTIRKHLRPGGLLLITERRFRRGIYRV